MKTVQFHGDDQYIVLRISEDLYQLAKLLEFVRMAQLECDNLYSDNPDWAANNIHWTRLTLLLESYETDTQMYLGDVKVKLSRLHNLVYEA